MPRALLTVLIWLAITGCASHRPDLITRADPDCHLSPTNEMVLAQVAQPTPALAALRITLKAELNRRGFNLTTNAGAEFVLACWIQDDWNVMRPGGAPITYGMPGPVGTITYLESPVMAPGPLTAGVSVDGRLERYLAYQSIQMELYSRARLRAGNFTPVWSGNIAGGTTIKLEQQRELLSVLLEHFGKSHVGRVKLP
jgi:hypothetical protein